MRFLATFSAFAVVAGRVALAAEPLNQQTDHVISLNTQEIEVIEANKTYVVKLECVGCPFPVQDVNGNVKWQQSQNNALRLEFTVDNVHRDKSTLMLNGESILPLDATPPYIQAQQLPINIAPKDLKSDGYSLLPWAVISPLQYEHTVLRTQEQGQLWMQFDVTGVPMDALNDPRYPALADAPVILDKKEQKIVQVLLRQQPKSDELFIQEIQVVTRADRVQPYRMKCGRLAMVQTTYDPREWDKYGKYGTWERTQNRILGEVGMWPLALSIALFVLLMRRWFQQRQQEVRDDAEFALLDTEYDDAPPAYSDIPIIKIEEYD